VEQVKTALGDMMVPFPDTSLLLRDQVTGATLLSLPRVSARPLGPAPRRRRHHQLTTMALWCDDVMAPWRSAPAD
jgi:hypothetical protein